MFGIGIPELLLVLLIVLILFGGKRLPELSKSLGQAIKEFKKGLSLDQTDSSKKKSKNTK